MSHKLNSKSKRIMRRKGKIKQWDDDKGFGFVTPDVGGKKVFIHISAFKNNRSRPEINQEITYLLATDKRGGQRAEKAKLAGEKTSKKGAFSLIIASCFLLGISYLTNIEKIPLMIFGIYCGMSALTFTVYALDKLAAKRGAWRISENKLHILSISGGWAGAIFAQQFLQHKSTKRDFRIVFWITVILNIGAGVWFLIPNSMELFLLYKYKIMFIFENWQHYIKEFI